MRIEALAAIAADQSVTCLLTPMPGPGFERRRTGRRKDSRRRSNPSRRTAAASHTTAAIAKTRISLTSDLDPERSLPSRHLAPTLPGRRCQRHRSRSPAGCRPASEAAWWSNRGGEFFFSAQKDQLSTSSRGIGAGSDFLGTAGFSALAADFFSAFCFLSGLRFLFRLLLLDLPNGHSHPSWSAISTAATGGSSASFQARRPRYRLVL